MSFEKVYYIQLFAKILNLPYIQTYFGSGGFKIFANSCI